MSCSEDDNPTIPGNPGADHESDQNSGEDPEPITPHKPIDTDPYFRLDEEEEPQRPPKKPTPTKPKLPPSRTQTPDEDDPPVKIVPKPKKPVEKPRDDSPEPVVKPPTTKPSTKPTSMNPPKKPISEPTPKPKPAAPNPAPLAKEPEHQAHYAVPLWPAPRKFSLKSGIVQDLRIKHIPVNIGRGGSASPSSRFHGIVVHMTYEPTLQATLNVWRKNQQVGTHFIIDKNGDIVQVASLEHYTNHVGPIRPRCNRPGGDKNACLCYSRGGNWKAIGAAESRKPYPRRNLMNQDSIGIEVVRWAKPNPGGTGDRTHNYLKAFYAQQYALTWLVKSLKLSFGQNWEVQRHPCIAWNKQLPEADSSDWDWHINKMEAKYRPQGRSMFS
jgi:hypothetical protein